MKRLISRKHKRILRDRLMWITDLKKHLFSGATDNPLPNCIILGAQKAGTSSLFNYLNQHPNVAGAARKEVHYFDLNYRYGENWYRSFFERQRGAERTPVYLEATPYYLFHPAVPARVRAALPDIRLIVLLRDPVERANSHYWHARERGFEPLELTAAFDAEDERLRDEEERLLKDIDYTSFAHQHLSYRSRGAYVAQISRWLEHFPMNQFLFLKAEDLFESPASVLSRTLDFLDLPAWSEFRLRPVNVGREKGRLPNDVRNRLALFYESSNKQLGAMIGSEFTWDTDHR